MSRTSQPVDHTGTTEPSKRQRHPTLRRLEDERTPGERLADRVAAFGGSWRFVVVVVGLIATWMILNTIVLARVLNQQPFDPYPYIALNLVLGALAALQAPVILMSQNRAAARDEALADHHYREGQQVDRILKGQVSLLEENTRLTREVHALSEQIRDLTSKIHHVVSSAAG